jgi:hypothetical protein
MLEKMQRGPCGRESLASPNGRRAAEEAEFGKQEAVHKRELKGMGKSRQQAAADLTAMQERIREVEVVAKTPEAENNSLLVQHD